MPQRMPSRARAFLPAKSQTTFHPAKSQTTFHPAKNPTTFLPAKNPSAHYIPRKMGVNMGAKQKSLLIYSRLGSG